MKALKIIGLGLLIWSLGLVWPELNLTYVLATVVIAGMVVGSVALALLWRDHLDKPTPPNRTRPRQPSHPVPVA
jgi:hypothetical protein